MRKYHVAFIIKMNHAEIIDKYKNIIIKNYGKIEQIEEKRTAQDIPYVDITYCGIPETRLEVIRTIIIDKSISKFYEGRIE